MLAAMEMAVMEMATMGWVKARVQWREMPAAMAVARPAMTLFQSRVEAMVMNPMGSAAGTPARAASLSISAKLRYRPSAPHCQQPHCPHLERARAMGEAMAKEMARVEEPAIT